MDINLHDYDLVIINTSSGKDSLVASFSIWEQAQQQGYPMSQIYSSHQDLGEAEWPDCPELAAKHTEMFEFKDIEYSKRRNFKGDEETLLEYVERRGKWPDNKNRYCTSDFKRGPGSRVVTKLSKELGECRVLYVFGFRKEESPSRSKKEPFTRNVRLTTKKRTVDEYLPVHTWSEKKVWEVIKGNKLPYHYAYDFGMPRLSCIFCVFSPFDALVIAGQKNPAMLDKYVEVEEKINHTFRNKFPIAEVRDAISQGYQPKKKIESWIM